MTYNYNIIADLHTHSIASGHSFNTITEMAIKAKELGLCAIAITEHGLMMAGGAHPWQFRNMVRLPHNLENVLVLKGVEANVCDANGKLDFSSEEFESLQLDWVIASIHQNIFKPQTQEEVFEAWQNIAKNPYVDMIGHCDQFACDYDKLVPIFKSNNKIVELNSASSVVRPGHEENMLQLIASCKKHKAKVAVNSDAHSIYALADFKNIVDLLVKAEFPSDLIINSDINLLREALRSHNKKAADEF